MPTVLISRSGPVATPILNRPEVRNALSPEMYAELAAALEQCHRDSSVRVVIITGQGDAFCAGGDLRAMEERALRGTPQGELRAFFAQTVAWVARRLHTLRQPVIARVNGVAAGAGCSLALGCDLRIASAAARFSLGFVQRGLIPDWGGSHLLPRTIGLSRACELVFTGRLIDAGEAERIGLVNRVVPASELDQAVETLACEIAALPPEAVSLAKQALHAGARSTLDEALELEAVLQSYCCSTADHREAVAAFRERRPPHFSGR